MADSGPNAGVQAAIQAILKLTYEQHAGVMNEAQRLANLANAVVSNMRSNSGPGHRVEPSARGSDILDSIYNRLHSVCTILSKVDDIEDPPELPSDAPRAITYSFSQNGVEAPAQYMSGSSLDGQAPSVPAVASPSVIDELPQFHPSDSAVQPALQQSESPATALTDPLPAEGYGSPAQPTTKTIVTASTSIGRLPSDAEISSRTCTSNGIRATPVRTKTSVGAASPTRKSASGKAHGKGCMEGTADQSNEGELSEGARGLRRYSQASQKVPPVSLGHRGNVKAGIDASCSALLVCQRTAATRVDGSVSRPVSCSRGHFNIPSANEVDLGTVQEVVMSFCSTPSDFWLHLKSSVEMLESMMDSIRGHCDGTGPQAGFEAWVGMFCVARNGEDDRWYRARIVERKCDYVQVLYVDFGKCALAYPHDLRPLDKKHALLPAQALHCTIQAAASIRSLGACSVAAANRFRRALKDAEHLEALFLSRDSLTGLYVVDLASMPAGGQAKISLSLQLLSQCAADAITAIRAPQAAAPPAGPPTPASATPPATSPPLAIPPRPPVPPATSMAAGPRPPTGAVRDSIRKGGAAARGPQALPSGAPLAPATALPKAAHAARIPPAVLPDQDPIPLVLSAFFSPTEFYAIPQTDDRSEKMLKDIQGQLANAALTSNPPTLDEVKEGTFWICLHNSDKNWYRVRVLKDAKEDDGRRARVLFVDSGNRCMTPVLNLRPLPAHLAEVPACAHRLALAFVFPRGQEGWDDEARRFFIAHTGVDTVLFAEKRTQRLIGFETVTDVLLWNKTCDPPDNINVLLLEHDLAILEPKEDEGSKH